MVHWLDSAGRRACGHDERWDELWDAMNQVAESVPRHPYVTSILAFSQLEPSGQSFQLHVPDRADINDALFRRICELGPRFGIVKPYRINVTTGDINDHPTELPAFSCASGRVAA